MAVEDVLVAGEGMADQHRIGAVGVERAVGLVGDLERGERDPGIELERLLRPEVGDEGLGVIRLPHPIRHAPAHDSCQFGHFLSQPPVRNEIGTGRYRKKR